MISRGQTRKGNGTTSEKKGDLTELEDNLVALQIVGGVIRKLQGFGIQTIISMERNGMHGEWKRSKIKKTQVEEGGLNGMAGERSKIIKRKNIFRCRQRPSLRKSDDRGVTRRIVNREAIGSGVEEIQVWSQKGWQQIRLTRSAQASLAGGKRLCYITTKSFMGGKILKNYSTWGNLHRGETGR